MKKIMISGATSGLGEEAAKQLHQLGHHIIALGRSEQKLAELRSRFVENISTYTVDLADLNSIKEVSKNILNDHPVVDVLINNAAVNLPERKTTKQNLEMHFGVNYLAHFALSLETMPALKKAPQGRIVNVGAVQLAKEFLWDDYSLENGWKNMKAITNAKLGIFMFTKALQRKLAETAVTANVLDPGLVRTPYHDDSNWILKLFVKLLGKSPEKCVRENYVWLATAPEIEGESGKFYSYKKEKRLKGEAVDINAQEKLWDLSLKLCGQKPL